MKRAILTALAILSVVSIAACASGIQKLRKIDAGMDTTAVEKIMGRRDSFASVVRDGYTYTLHKYTNRLCNAHSSIYDKCDFYVIYRDGIVIETGVSEVRSSPPNMQYIYLFNVN